MSIQHVVIIFCVLAYIGVKADLHVYVEDISIEKINPEYFDPVKTEFYIVESSSDENTINANLSVVKEPPLSATGRFKLSGLSGGRYNIPTGIDVTMDFCEMVAEPIVLGPFFAVLGFKEDACPPEPGDYFQEGFVPPVENLPEDFPENKYLAHVDISVGGKPIIMVYVFIDIQH